ncbi:hypothetical protein [Afipia sp. GAS231]|uniref:hypothetical protein n=1 Tax=Afipia sp. GAS231 TaxID=1882747 RepID=UPI00087B88C0|nr:hypothetical protein [Afipia sp. GAS231]SDO53801.1 hypothetical protein SAMN05444050_4389 [Afipia sp. GAS231]
MTTKDRIPADRVRGYLGHLPRQSRSSLLAEIERMQMYGQDISGFEAILAELRAEFRKDGQSHSRVGNPSRYFFKPIEALFVDRAAERANSGQISRGSLAPIWDWISLTVLPAMARDYDDQMRPLIVANDLKEAGLVAAAFQSKVVKSVEGILASPEGTERVRSGLAKYTSSHGCISDLTKILSAMRARDAIVAFNEVLPPTIDNLEGETLAKVRALLDAFATKHPEALPFALTMTEKRLKTPWQQIRLATKIAQGSNAKDLAATAYAITVPMVLDHLEDKRMALSQALKNNRILVAKDILIEIYDTEHALQVGIGELNKSDWGHRLDELMAAVTADLQAELKILPGKVHHVLGSVRRHGGPPGLLADLAQKGCCALVSGMSYCRDIMGIGHKPDG